jgi:hypothetical protein
MNFNIIISHYYTFDYHVYILRGSIPIFDTWNESNVGTRTRNHVKERSGDK